MDEVKQILEDMSELQKYIVLLLNANENGLVKGSSWFQKELFLIAKNIPEVEEEASFDSDMFGPWSENAKEQLDELEMDDVVSKSGKKMWLSDLGMNIAEKLIKKVPEDRLVMISEFKDLLNDLTDTEMLTLIYFTFPEFTEESLIKDKIYKTRGATAVRLYKKGKISLQRASEIAGEPLEKFARDFQK